MIRTSDFVTLAVSLAERTPPIPYALGGTTPQGMDCRGLVVYLLRQLGEASYRAAGATSMWRDDCVDKRPIAQAELRPGDLLFIRSGDTSEHMGVYCGAPGCEVVHASATKGCVCASTIQNGWTHAARHRLIDYDSTDREEGDSMAAEYIVRAQGGLRQRKTPGGTYMQMIPDGTRLTALQTQGDWTQVSYGGFTGWVSAAYLADADGAAEAPQEPEDTSGPETDGDEHDSPSESLPQKDESDSMRISHGSFDDLKTAFNGLMGVTSAQAYVAAVDSLCAATLEVIGDVEGDVD